MPRLWTNNIASLKEDIVAILCSDIHLSHKCPIARTAEPDWYLAMDRGLSALRKLKSHFKCPVVCAGDIFDKWNPPPELINFAIDHLPDMYAIPGQHDLKHHNLEDISKTGYWTLVRAGRITNLNPDARWYDRWIESPNNAHHIRLHPFPWGTEITRLPIGEGKERKSTVIDLAVVHKYIWKDAHSKYHGAPIEANISKLAKSLTGYTAAVFGDNHKGFSFRTKSGTNVFNCGTFFRRHSDEIDYTPTVGLLTTKGEIIPFPFKSKFDKFLDRSKLATLLDQEDLSEEAEEFLQELQTLGEAVPNFINATRRYLSKNNVAKSIRQIILEAMEEE